MSNRHQRADPAPGIFQVKPAFWKKTEINKILLQQILLLKYGYLGITKLIHISFDTLYFQNFMKYLDIHSNLEKKL